MPWKKCLPVPPATSRCFIPGNGFSSETNLEKPIDEHWKCQTTCK